jgi:hypothetical protein
MNQTEIIRGLKELAGEGMPASIDLWPRVRAKVGASPRRRAAPRRKAIALLMSAVAVLTLALGALSPTGTNASANALGLFGLQPIALAPVGPSCVKGSEKVDPIYTPAEPGAFTVSKSGGATEPQPSGTGVAVSAMRLDCPEGYEVSFNTPTGSTNGVLNFLGVTSIAGAPAGPGCVGEGGRVELTPTLVDPTTFTIGATSSEPLPGIAVGTGQAIQGVAATRAVPAAQISCPEGYELTFDEK